MMHALAPAVIPFFGETLSLATAVVWALAIIMFKKSGESVHPIGLNLAKDVLAVMLFLPTIFLFGSELFRNAPAKDYILLFLSGGLGIGVADTLLFICLNRIGAGLTAIVDCLYSPFVIVLSCFFLGETLTFYQMIGAGMILSAVFVATYQRGTKQVDRRNIVIGVLYGASSLLMTAIGIVLVKPVLDRSPLLWVTEMRLLSGVTVLCVILLFHTRRKPILKSIISAKHWAITLAGSFMGGYLAMILWLAGMKYTQASTSAVLNQTTNVFIFIFAAIFLRERITTQRTVGIVIAVLGALLVTFGKNIEFMLAP